MVGCTINYERRSMSAFKKLKKLYGTDEKIALAFGVTRQAVLYWKRKGIPFGRAVRAEKLTKGIVTAADVLKG